VAEVLEGLFFIDKAYCYLECAIVVGGMNDIFWKFMFRVSEFTVDSLFDSSMEDVGSLRLFVEELRTGRGQQGDIGEVGMNGWHCTVMEMSASPYQICSNR
jgi:hypothetical protein